MSTSVTISGGRKRASRDESVQAAKRARSAFRNKKFKVGRSLNTKYHQFVRSVSFGSAYQMGMDLKTGFLLNGFTTGSFNMQFAFKLSGVEMFIGGVSQGTLPMPNFNEFKVMYDQYRIDYVACQFMFSNNNSSTSSPGTTLPVVYLCKDYDDTANASVVDIQQYATQRTWQLGSQQGRNGMKVIKIKPNVDLAVYNGLTTGYARGKPMFVDTSSDSVPHYGIKLAFDPIFIPAAATNVGYLSCNFVYHMTMAHSK